MIGVKNLNIRLTLLVLFLNVSVFAQNPYEIVGAATQDDCNCYTLTNNTYFEASAVWNKNQLDLSQPFNYKFNVFLGCADTAGADGMAFVLQTRSTGVGIEGAGFGFQEITPSVGATIDTYQNSVQDDPQYDHFAIQANGDTYHSSANNLAGPVPVFANNDNIEDCNWHVLGINWAPATNLLEVSIDGELRLSLTKNIIQDIFNNNPLVYWGFTAGTGTNFSVQKFCAPLESKFALSQPANSCVGMPFSFIDSSKSYGAISNWYWDFGDGTTSALKNPQPYSYSNPGTYDITLNVKGGDGCLSDTFTQTITVGAYPQPAISTNVATICTKDTVLFTDTSAFSGGTKNYWFWDFGNGKTSNMEHPPPVSYNAGNYTVKLFVNTKENCPSDTVVKSFSVGNTPEIDFTKTDTCNNIPVNFTAQNLTPNIAINNWRWNFGDNTITNSTVSSAVHTYANGGVYEAALLAQAENGCYADTVVKTVQVYGSAANAGNDTIIIMGEPFQLQGSGGEIYTWSPSSGLSNPNIPNPVATLYEDATYTLTTTTAIGCASTDTINLKVFKGPEIYIPTAFTPNGDGRNDNFRITPVGIQQIIYFKVMNRWGEVMYESKNAAASWNGSSNGVLQPSGTYIWIIAGKTSTGAIFKKQGTVVLIR